MSVLFSAIGKEYPYGYRFRHQAMATEYEILIIHKDSTYASQAAQAAFERVDELEQSLSFFIPNSDVGKINSAPINSPIKLGIDVFQCLFQCQIFYKDTFGAFNVLYKSGMQKPFDWIELDKEDYTLIKKSESIKVDLGGFGKGYAVDEMAEVLDDWEIDRALIHGGRSSVLSINPPPNKKGWPLTIHHPLTQKHISTLHLSRGSLSASGLQKGNHIVDTRSEEEKMKPTAVWIFSDSASDGDALSTAMMLMSERETQEYCRKHPQVGVMAIYEGEGIEVFGNSKILNID